MTIEEFLGKEKLAGRMIETVDSCGFMFRAEIKNAGRWNPGEVCIFLGNVSRRFKNSELPWRKVNDCQIVLASETPVEEKGGAFSFPLAGGGRAEILPKGKKLPAAEEDNG